MPDSVLAIDHVSHSFGGLKAVDDCSFTVERGTITALIGPNGAGKTTLVNLVSGAIACRKGSIVFDGHAISGRPSYQIAQRRLIRSFQISRELGSLTVLETTSAARAFSTLSSVPRSVAKRRGSTSPRRWECSKPSACMRSATSTRRT